MGLLELWTSPGILATLQLESRFMTNFSQHPGPDSRTQPEFQNSNLIILER